MGTGNNLQCSYNVLYIVEWIERPKVANTGVGITGIIGNKAGAKTLPECKIWCEDTDGCNSIAFEHTRGDCWLKEKCLTEDEPSDGNVYSTVWKSYYRPCKSSSMPLILLNQISEIFML